MTAETVRENAILFGIIDEKTYTAKDMESFAEWCNDCPYALLADGKWSIIDDNVIVTTAQLRKMWEQERSIK